MRKAAIVLGAALLVGGCGGSATHTTLTTTSPTSTSSSPATGSSSTTSSTPAPTVSAERGAIAEVRGAGGELTNAITGDGSLSTAAADGRGGWFIAGSFTRLDGMPERGLAHVLAGGAIDPNWHGALASSGRTALVAFADTLYAAGSISDTDRSHLYALDAATGTSRRSLPVPPGPISALALSGGRLFVATSTTTSARQPSCLEAIDPRSGTRVAGFTADVRLAPELGCITALRADGQWLYLAGAFRSVNGSHRPRIARLDASTGRLDASWNPPATSIPNAIYDLAVGSGNVFVAGSTPALSALETASGTPPSAWHPPAGISAPLSLALLGARLLVAGQLHGRDSLLSLGVSSGALQSSWQLPHGRSAELVSASGSAALVALGHG